MISVVVRSCVNCGASLEGMHAARNYCSEACKIDYRKPSKRNYAPPPFVGSYDLLPANLKQLFTPGDPAECWISSKRGPNGYATNTSVKMYKGNAYRLIYMMLVGPVAEGLELHHTCHNGAGGCVNPHHLESVSHRDNILKGSTIMAAKYKRDYCIHGHPLDYIEPLTGKRACTTCKRSRNVKRGRIPKPVFCTYCKAELEQHAKNYRRPYCDSCKASFEYTPIRTKETA